jgi:NAD(P)-dependent dehydrogenase (short-subunit alcohol dehydrogenase family)
VPNASIPANKLFSLSHTAVIVTGGARGLGLATAIALLESHSPHVYCTDVLPSPSEAEWKIAQETAEKYGSKVEYRQLDITNENTVDATFESMYNDCETEIGAFFGAAGIQQQIPALDYPAKDFRRIMEVNVTGEWPQVKHETELMVVRHFPISTGCRKADEEEGDQGNHLYDGVYVWIYRQQG